MPAGRKRGFDDQAALQRAMELFWRQGYEGTSIADLTAAMGINPPSLYAAFGSKRDLFEKALGRYMCQRTVQMEAAIAAPGVYDAVTTLLLGRIDVFTDPELPAGCMTVQSGLSLAEPHAEIVEMLSQARESMRLMVLERIIRAVTEGELSSTTGCEALTRFIMTTLYGLSVEAAAGAPKNELVAAARLATEVVQAMLSQPQNESEYA
ncbi:TetR/AcrR family transcriptional regulator [Arthrobacter sp. MDB2-24]